MFIIPAFLLPGIIWMPLPPRLPHLVWGIGKAPSLRASCTKVEINSDGFTVPHSLLCWYSNETFSVPALSFLLYSGGQFLLVQRRCTDCLLPQLCNSSVSTIPCSAVELCKYTYRLINTLQWFELLCFPLIFIFSWRTPSQHFYLLYTWNTKAL